MSAGQSPTGQSDKEAEQPSGGSPVYILARSPDEGEDSRYVSLLDVVGILWDARRLVIGLTAFIVLAAVVYALLATEWYRAEVLAAPAEERSNSVLSGQLGNLAALAGVKVGGGDAEAVAFLRSRTLVRDFIEKNDLLPVLFHEEWDAAKNQWTSTGGEPPDIREGVRFFRETVLNVREDPITQLITVSVLWTDPVVAAGWANSLVKEANEQMRQRALSEANVNLGYLESELSKTSIVTLQQSLGRLLESELQKLMLARGSEEFSFRVIDKAVPPDQRVKPRRTLIVLAAGVLGGFFSIAVVLIRHGLRGLKRDGTTAD